MLAVYLKIKTKLVSDATFVYSFLTRGGGGGGGGMSGDDDDGWDSGWVGLLSCSPWLGWFEASHTEKRCNACLWMMLGAKKGQVGKENMTNLVWKTTTINEELSN
jgi:hypothetical protein